MNIKKIFESKEYKNIKQWKKYKFPYVFCGKNNINIKNSVNEGICYRCRSV